ncbi:MAG TPA: mandelate racemase/muconate lactonizing enzyme family protein [Candidatus Eisenbacteria bacterium]|nr:mandelate racemase/muconate lactonizing enzyme family protein [Candidatus Eisenbacteria bacterium]
MKITRLRPIRLCAAVPAEHRVRSRSGVRRFRATTLVRIDTDGGPSGYGSCSGNGALIAAVIERVLEPLLLGSDPTDIDGFWKKAYVRGGVKEFGSRGVGVVALSGVEVALWDIRGKLEGLPLYRLLGDKCRERVPVYATALYPDEPDAVVERARLFAEAGFHGVKIKVGFDLAQDIQIVRAVRRALGKRFPIMTDANQGYERDVALRAADAFAAEDVLWFEEPLFVEDIEGHALLRKQGRVRIAVGENLHTAYAFENFCAREAADYLQPDVARVGGIGEVKKIAALAREYGGALSLHTWGDAVALAASVHLSAALPECAIMEFDATRNPLREELLREPLEVRHGFIIPPEKPGLGVEPDPDALRRFESLGTETLSLRDETVKTST